MFRDELNCQQWRLIALQKSAEGIVLESQEGPNNEEDAAVWLDHGYCTRRCPVGYGVKTMVASMSGKEIPDDTLVDQH